MAYKLELKQEARKDIITGFFWYEEKQKGLGSRFVDEVEQTVDYLEENPYHFQKRRKTYREAVLKRFSYVIVYEIFGNEVIGYSVFPCKANPEKKLK